MLAFFFKLVLIFEQIVEIFIDKTYAQLLQIHNSISSMIEILVFLNSKFFICHSAHINRWFILNNVSN